MSETNTREGLMPICGKKRAGQVHDWARIAARLLDSVREKDGLDALYAELKQLCAFNNFIVYIFREDVLPVLLWSNRGVPAMQQSMSDYIKGLYALDPFHKITVGGQSGLFRMRDIMPEAFPQSEYYRRFYKFTDVCDELRYIVRPDADSTVHVFIEREGKYNAFKRAEVDLFQAITPFINSFVSLHIQWQDQNRNIEVTPAQKFNLRARVQDMPGNLTPREVDTVELMLKGHSTKSIARVLDIDPGTVANHKRHIYEKLDVHSQAQLFDLFIRCLS